MRPVAKTEAILLSDRRYAFAVGTEDESIQKWDALNDGDALELFELHDIGDETTIRGERVRRVF